MQNFPYYYPKTLERYYLTFGEQFKGIEVKVYDTSGVATKTIPVSIVAGPLDKTYSARLVAEAKKTGRTYYEFGPVIGYSCKSISYDKPRVTGQNELLNSFNPTSAFDDLTGFITQINPSPWNYEFNIEIKAFYMNDMAQILENVLPYFRPQINVRIKEFSFLNIERDIKIELTSEPTLQYLDDLDENQRREIKCNIGFTLYGFMYKPISHDKIIKFIKTNYFVGDNGILTDSYSTSGFDTSAEYPQSSQYETSGSFDDGKWFTSSVSYD